jgi:ABC-type lipoprotein release transport system permease subunit
MSNLLDAQRRSWHVGAAMFVAFGVLALLVASVGLYGVLSYDVGQRMHELGVRIALGAQRTDVMRLVVGHGVRVALAGVAAGGAIALAGRCAVRRLDVDHAINLDFVGRIGLLDLRVVGFIADRPGFD